MGLKGFAYHVTGSVGLLSDALESLVNLAGALMALASSPPPPRRRTRTRVRPQQGGVFLERSRGNADPDRRRQHRPRRGRPTDLSEALGASRRGLAVAVWRRSSTSAVALVLRRAGTRERSIALTAALSIF
jgi:hypothetical protein